MRRTVLGHCCTRCAPILCIQFSQKSVADSAQTLTPIIKLYMLCSFGHLGANLLDPHMSKMTGDEPSQLKDTETDWHNFSLSSREKCSKS